MLPGDILLINDGSFLLRMLGKRLHERGYEAWITDDPERGVELLRQHDFELAVLKLPEQEAGRQAVYPILREITQETELILVGGAQSLPLEVFETDFTDYIALPCSPTKLWRRVAVFLEDSRADRQRELLLHPANYRLVQSLVANLQEVRRNLTIEGAGLSTLAENLAHHLPVETVANLDEAQQRNLQSTFLVERLLANFTEHDFFQDQVDWYDI